MPYIKFKNNMLRKKYWTGADGVELIGDWRRRGISVEDIARQKIGVAPETLERWRQQTPELD